MSFQRNNPRHDLHQWKYINPKLIRLGLPLKWQDKFDICLTVHHWYKWYRQLNRFNNNGLLIIPISSTCFGRRFRPFSGALDCVYSLWYNAPTMLPGCGGTPLPGYRPATSWVHCTTSCNTQSSAPEDGRIIPRNMLSWLELLINRYCCT